MIKDIDEKLKKIIAKNLRMGISVEDISDDSDLINDFVFDSVQLIRLIADMENVFDITVDNEFKVIETLSRYGSLRDFVTDKLGCKGE